VRLKDEKEAIESGKIKSKYLTERTQSPWKAPFNYIMLICLSNRKYKKPLKYAFQRLLAGGEGEI
jgi:hypothetical protein